MKKNRWIKTGADMVILLCSVILCVQIYFESHRLEQSLLIFYLLVFVGVLALADLIYQVYCQKRKREYSGKAGAFQDRSTGNRSSDFTG